MSTLNQLIKRFKHRPCKKLYIKRRDLAGNYESTWLRIDNKNQRDIVLNWGSFSLEIDNQPSEIATFNISGLTLLVDNSDGLFSREDLGLGSLWEGFLNRRNSKIKIDVGYYYDDDNNVIGEATIFEGIIDRVVISEDYTAHISCLPYTNILTKYDISDLNLTGEMTTSAIVTAIMNQSKITTYIPYTVPNPTINSIIVDAANLDGSYWDVLKELALYSNSIPFLNNNVFSFQSRVASGSSVWDFKGTGSDEAADIFNINYYDDEGADRLRVFWKSQGEDISVKSSDANLLLKYLNEAEILDLEKVKSTSKLALLTSYLASWQNPQRVIEFSTKFMVNIVSPLNKITLEIFGRSTVPYRWGGIVWSPTTPPSWGKLRGGIKISSGTLWRVSKVVKDIQNWSNVIRTEEIV